MSVGLSGRVIVSKDGNLSQEAITDRIAAIERYVFGHPTGSDKDAANKSTASIAQRIKALEDSLETVETHDVKILHIGLLDIGPRLGDWSKPVAQPDSLPLHVKLRLVVAERQKLERICGELKEIKELQGFMNPAYLNEIPVYLKRISALEAKYIALAERSRTFQQQFQKTLKDYNELVDLLSLKAAEWDEKLAAIEDKVGV